MLYNTFLHVSVVQENVTTLFCGWRPLFFSIDMRTQWLLAFMVNKISINTGILNPTSVDLQLQSTTMHSECSYGSTDTFLLRMMREREYLISVIQTKKNPKKGNKIPSLHMNLILGSWDQLCCVEQLVECWMRAWMVFWYAFIGPLVKGSNRYHDGRACFCHDTSPIWHEKALFHPMIGQVLYIDGKKQHGH